MVMEIAVGAKCPIIIPGDCNLSTCKQKCFETYKGVGECIEKQPPGSGYKCLCVNCGIGI